MGKFDNLLLKEGETVSHYVHSWESSRNTTTNLKVSKWAVSTNIKACVRSQSKVPDPKDFGLHFLETIALLTKTNVQPLDVVKWNNKYFDALINEAQYWKGVLQYYKVTCQERIEFLGA